MAPRPRVVFLCIGNACRSPMAEGWLRHLAGDRLEAASGGIAPIGVHRLATRVMAEVGVDLSGQRSRYVGDALAEGADLLISLSPTALRGLPPTPLPLLLWPTPDPYGAEGTEEDVLDVFRAVRDGLRERIEDWLEGGAAPLP